MHTKIIQENEALALATKEESHFYDRKAIEVSGQKIQKISVGLANADGGEFIVGIADDKEDADPSQRWKGAKTIEDLNSHIQALMGIQPSLDFRGEVLKCDNKPGYVLRVLIEKSSVVHKTADGTVYQRKGAQSLPLNVDQIVQLSFAKGASSFEDSTLRNIPAEQIVDSQELGEFLSEYSPKTDPLEFCLNQNLFDYKTWEVRVAAGMLFHSNPSAIMPRKCGVKITRYETREEDPERDHLAEQVTVEGPLYKVIHEAIGHITRIMSSTDVWTPDGLKKLEYPPESIWEIFVNALIHRDYSISDDVHALIYNDRIEVLSPGRLPGYVNIQNILSARYARNPKIVRTLNRYKNAPNKDMGEGLNTAFQKMKDWGLKNPEIFEENNYVKVILPHATLATPADAILLFTAKHGKVSNYQVRDITGIKSENSVKNEFYKLRDAGFIERVPGLEGPKAAWQLTEKGKAHASKIEA